MSGRRTAGRARGAATSTMLRRAWDRGWAAVLRRRWALLILWMLLVAGGQLITTQRWLGSWHYIVTGVSVLVGADPLSLYAVHPELQMGPITFVLSAPFVLVGGPLGLLGAALAMEAVGLLTLREIRALLRPGDVVGERRWFLTSLAVVLGWSVLAVRFGHPDDVLALFAAVWGLRLLRSGAFLRSALLIAIAVDCKPWMAPLAFVLLAAPRRRWLPAAVIVAAVVAVMWVPFLLHPGTLRATGFTIAVDPTASIRLLGLASGRTPFWCRPAQMLVGAAVVAVLARRRRWHAALLAVVVVRLLLDPSTHVYYDAGLLVAAAVLDVGSAVPVATLIVLIGVHLPPMLQVAVGPQAVLRLVSLLALLVLAVVAGPRGRATAPPTAIRGTSVMPPRPARRGPGEVVLSAG